jgi:hypothetical protein
MWFCSEPVEPPDLGSNVRACTVLPRFFSVGYGELDQVLFLVLFSFAEQLR